jgi:hypothetical protein
MRLLTAFLPIALTGMLITSSVDADEACTAAYDAAGLEVALGDSCTEVDGMCPDTCAELVASLDAVCAGKSYTIEDGTEEVYNQAITVQVFQLLSTGACVDVDLTPGEDTCDEVFIGFTVEVLVGDSCTEVDGVCPEACEELFTSLDSTCDGKSYSVDGEETKYKRGATIRAYKLLMDPACADEISGATILGTNASAALVTGSIALISSFLFL